MRSDRRWLELRLRTTEGPLRDLVPDALVDLGARGVVEEADGHVAYFEEPDDPDAFVSGVRDHLGGMGADPDLEVDWRWQEHEAWAQSWKRGLAPRRITERLVVHPSWKRPVDPRPDDIAIVLDPGMAFGTAEHGTTRGCLRLLDGTVGPGDRVLDVGAGSGILSIAAARLGAGKVTAIEGDGLACEAIEDNLRRNGVAGRVRPVRTWADAETIAVMGPFEGVIANIETGLLLPLIPGLVAALAPDGWLVLSGILEHEWERVEDEVERLGPGAVEVDADGEWRSGLFRA